jgi:tRNA (mo5U34)-methyltransferase
MCLAGTLDITLYLGVLYHMQDPFGCLKRLAHVTRELAVIETAAVCVPGFEDRAPCEFYESNELNADVSNWWAPSQIALLAMCRAAGFSRVEVISREPQLGVGRAMVDAMRGALRVESQKPISYRAIAHAWK